MYYSQVPMDGIPLSWTIHIPTHEDTLLWHLIHLLEINITPGLMNVITSRIGLFLDGYATLLECRSGLMYMSLLGEPTDQDLEEYPHVLLTSPHGWNPSVLDYTHPHT